MDFGGKTALVTGAAGAIGKGIASGFCKGGARVFITDINQEAVDAAAKEISAEGWHVQAELGRGPSTANGRPLTVAPGGLQPCKGEVE